jgi:hypothetical protein
MVAVGVTDGGVMTYWVLVAYPIVNRQLPSIGGVPGTGVVEEVGVQLVRLPVMSTRYAPAGSPVVGIDSVAMQPWFTGAVNCFGWPGPLTVMLTEESGT